MSSPQCRSIHEQFRVVLRRARAALDGCASGQQVRANPYELVERVMAMSEDDRLILSELLYSLARAEVKHPVFAEGPYQALGVLSEEHGEVIRTITKDEGEARVYEESIDLLTVAWRFARGDWK